MKKILLIGDSPISMSPYVMSYIEVFDKYQIPYELVYWNKTLEDVSKLPKEYIPYNQAHNNIMPGWKKFFKIYKFTRFVKLHMKNNDYAYIVIFTIAHAVFFHPLIEKKYKGRYVFDIRDHSPLCRSSFIRRIIKKLINDSAFTVLSSRGFLHWLPDVSDTKIVISHNTTLCAVEYGLKNTYLPNYATEFIDNQDARLLKVLTIGQLRDYYANAKILRTLSNLKGFKLLFAGMGPSKEKLEKLTQDITMRNVSFLGRYKKSDEEKIVNGCDVINNYTNQDVNSNTLMSNRFYLSVIYRKPMIVRSGTYQADMVEKFRLGCVIKDDDNIPKLITTLIFNLNREEYNESCISFLNYVQEDIFEFENKINRLYNKWKV